MRVESISIPDPFKLHSAILNITIEEFRSLYSLTWSQNNINEKLEKFIESLNDKAIVEVNTIQNIKIIKGFQNKNHSKSEDHMKTKAEVEDEKKLLIKIWKLLLSKNIYAIKVDETIYDEWLIELLLKFCRSSCNQTKSKLQYIELKINDTNDVKRILEALQSNFMVKRIILKTEKRVNLEIEKLVEEFCLKRIGTKVMLNCENKCFQILEDKCFELLYPNEEE